MCASSTKEGNMTARESPKGVTGRVESIHRTAQPLSQAFKPPTIYDHRKNERDRPTAYKTTQPFFFPLLVRLRSAARVAYWNTSRTPSPDLAEHSR